MNHWPLQWQAVMKITIPCHSPPKKSLTEYSSNFKNIFKLKISLIALCRYRALTSNGTKIEHATKKEIEHTTFDISITKAENVHVPASKKSKNKTSAFRTGIKILNYFLTWV